MMSLYLPLSVRDDCCLGKIYAIIQNFIQDILDITFCYFNKIHRNSENHTMSNCSFKINLTLLFRHSELNQESF